jgi:hypothetical protein
MTPLSEQFTILEYKRYRSFDPASEGAIGRLFSQRVERGGPWDEVELDWMEQTRGRRRRDNHHGWLVKTYSELHLYVHFWDGNVAVWLMPGGDLQIL